MGVYLGAEWEMGPFFEPGDREENGYIRRPTCITNTRATQDAEVKVTDRKRTP